MEGKEREVNEGDLAVAVASAPSQRRFRHSTIATIGGGSVRDREEEEEEEEEGRS